MTRGALCQYLSKRTRTKLASWNGKSPAAKFQILGSNIQQREIRGQGRGEVFRPNLTVHFLKLVNDWSLFVGAERISLLLHSATYNNYAVPEESLEGHAGQMLAADGTLKMETSVLCESALTHIMRFAIR